MIRILPESLVNKIAAGEVIVRPASVVKELVENAIDAGAQRIVIELANSCRDIRVRDDGCGISREDLPRALLRHATSKIETFEDLWRLRTRGFRGEALASIAAVARLTILSRPQGTFAGARLVSEPGQEPRVEAAGAPEGTDVWVRDLFFNTPVRLKFLKTPASELQLILSMVTRQALIRPEVGFVVSNEREKLLEVPPLQPWRDRVVALLGIEAANHLLEVDGHRHDIHVCGFAADPAFSRKDRRYQFFFVNGRPITHRMLSNVVQQAYKGLLMTQRFAVVVLDIELAPREVDVNVHPTKEEVRFRNEAIVLGAVHRAVQECLARANLLPTLMFPQTSDAFATQSELLPASHWLGSPTSTLPPMPGDFSPWTNRPPSESNETAVELARILAANQELEDARHAAVNLTNAPTAAAQSRCDVHPLRSGSSEVTSMPSPDCEAQALLLTGGQYPEPLGQVADCYIVARAGENLLLIDQHAAHERLLYMRLCSRAATSMNIQPLLIPVTVDVPPDVVPLLQSLASDFEATGLHIEHFGGTTFVVQSVPADLPFLDAGAVLADIVDDYLALGKSGDLGDLRDRILTRMACRGAIKSGQRLSLDEMRQLIRDLVDSRMGFTCPHGRPTMILLTRAQLDRQFKRIVS
jgi:DNA mismatch repair protein MutL